MTEHTPEERDFRYSEACPRDWGRDQPTSVCSRRWIPSKQSHYVSWRINGVLVDAEYYA